MNESGLSLYKSMCLYTCMDTGMHANLLPSVACLAKHAQSDGHATGVGPPAFAAAATGPEP